MFIVICPMYMLRWNFIIWAVQRLPTDDDPIVSLMILFTVNWMIHFSGTRCVSSFSKRISLNEPNEMSSVDFSDSLSEHLIWLTFVVRLLSSKVFSNDGRCLHWRLSVLYTFKAAITLRWLPRWLSTDRHRLFALFYEYQ